MRLGDIVGSIGTFLHLPEWGISERLNGQKKGATAPQPIIPQGAPLATQRTDSSGPYAGYSSGTNTARAVTQQAQPAYMNTSSYVDSAKAARDSMLSAIQSRLDETRRQASQQIDNARGARDYTVNFINQRFPELINRTNSQRQADLGGLQSQETDLQNIYDRAQAQARRRAESAALNNRMIARAGNRLGSSFYDETVAQNQENLGRVLGESDAERINKMAAIGTQRTKVNENYNNTIKDLESEKNQATYKAMDEYNKSVQAADALSRAGVLDFGEGLSQAEQNLASRLDAIKQWAQGMAQQQMALESAYKQGGTYDTTMGNYATQNNSFLTNNGTTPAAQALQGYQSTILGTPSTEMVNPNYLAYGIQKPQTLNDILLAATA